MLSLTTSASLLSQSRRARLAAEKMDIWTVTGLESLKARYANEKYTKLVSNETVFKQVKLVSNETIFKQAKLVSKETIFNQVKLVSDETIFNAAPLENKCTHEIIKRVYNYAS